MTILVGILCTNGVVIASDGMASMNLGTTPFVGHSNLKTHVIDNKVIIACAGDDNLMTQFVHFFRSNYLEYSKKHELQQSSSIFTLMHELSSQFAQDIINAIKQYPDELTNNLLQQINNNGFDFNAIVGAPFNGKHYIFQYDTFLRPHMLRENGIWHIILGSGHLVGNPSIHLVKKILNIKAQPEIDRGQILAYWTISHAIEVSSGGIGGEITTAVLQKINGQYSASIENKVSEHKSFIEDMYNYIGKYGNSIDENSSIQEIPKL